MTTFPANHPAYPDALDLCAPVIETGDCGMKGWRGVTVPSVARPGSLAVLWFNVMDGGQMQTSITHGTALDLSHPLGRAQLARVLAAGLKCPECKGTGAPDRRILAPGGLPYCETCSGTGYLRTPSDVRRVQPVAEMGALPMAYAEFAPALLAWHAEDVGRGGPGVLDVLAGWRREFRYADGRKSLTEPDHMPPVVVHDTTGWEVRVPGKILRGPETGPEGKRLADLAALAHGMALLDADGLRVPVGGGE